MVAKLARGVKAQVAGGATAERSEDGSLRSDLLEGKKKISPGVRGLGEPAPAAGAGSVKKKTAASAPLMKLLRKSLPMMDTPMAPPTAPLLPVHTEQMSLAP
ncbi:hypothetical protein NDU88_001396 [Pleurodeles waltl]|uniref:Uncharacterized protein n=1 Tax=Pleurodeles waltl TaxID=8319 RepID=A0AAV7UVY4_PLEWA|nr:hypothetical protein NDU88_001396 [Pleurodeles waltl]